MSWLILAFVIPIVIAWGEGSTFLFAFSLTGIGLLAYLLNTALIGFFISRRALSSLENATWEQTARTGVVPKWVSIVGLVGTGFTPAGLVVAALLYLGIVIDRG